MGQKEEGYEDVKSGSTGGYYLDTAREASLELRLRAAKDAGVSWRCVLISAHGEIFDEESPQMMRT